MNVSYNVTLEVALGLENRQGVMITAPRALVTISTNDKELLNDLVDAIGQVNYNWGEE